MKNWKRIACALLAMLMVMALAACGGESGGNDVTPPNPATCTFNEMVEYLTAKGYIAEGTTPVDINTTEGYVEDNTGGDFPVATVADRAEDYAGLWLLWFDAETPSELYTSNFEYIDMNAGMIVIGGGAAVLQTAAWNGSFAIAFAGDYAQKDAVIADFNALPAE